jgi:2',3'-cyclic-nucleotide 2'-phosphodiesterase (5'-nucleotidase family)
LDALKWRIPEVDIVLSNGFRFCPPCTTPDHTGNIPITEGFIYDMLPVDSTVRTGNVTGKQLKEWLEKELNNVFAKEAFERFGGWVMKFKGMKISFDAFKAKGKRVHQITVGNAALDLNRTYSICACERDGDPSDMLCRMRNVNNAINTHHTLHSVLKEYLAANSPVTPTPPINAKIMDAPQTLLTQITGVDYQFH